MVPARFKCIADNYFICNSLGNYDIYTSTCNNDSTYIQRYKGTSQSDKDWNCCCGNLVIRIKWIMLYYKIYIFDAVKDAADDIQAFPAVIIILLQELHAFIRDEYALFTFVVPFLISTAGGTLIAAIVLAALNGTGVLKQVKAQLNA